jgi:chromosome segregation ATPase
MPPWLMAPQAHYEVTVMAARDRATNTDSSQIAELENRCRDLEERLRRSDDQLKKRSGRLYEIERHYASEHFQLQESMRNLNVERMRNAGAFADRDVILGRAKELQSRIRELKARLRKHEHVEDLLFDEAPIVADDR